MKSIEEESRIELLKQPKTNTFHAGKFLRASARAHYFSFPQTWCFLTPKKRFVRKNKSTKNSFLKLLSFPSCQKVLGTLKNDLSDSF